MVRAGLVVLESLALTWTQRLFLAFCSLTDLHCFIFLIPEVLRVRTKAAARRPSICLRMYVRRTRGDLFPQTFLWTFSSLSFDTRLSELFLLVYQRFTLYVGVKWEGRSKRSYTTAMWFATGCSSASFASPVLIWNLGVVPFTGLIKGARVRSIIREFVKLLTGSSKSFLCSIYYFLPCVVERFVYVQ